MGRVYSVSQVQAYQACSLKYRFQYIDQLPRPWRPSALAFGTSVHAAVEWFHKERLDGRAPKLEDMLNLFDADWFAQNLEPIVFPDKETKESLQAKGRAMLTLYAGETHPQPVAVEEGFEEDLADPESGELLDVRLRGYIDLLEEDETLVDLKTAARALPQEDLDRHLQLSTYALIHLLRTGRIPKLRIDLLLKTKEPRLERLPTTRSVDDLSWTARLIAGVVRSIEAGMFVPNPSWRCTECEYFAQCQSWRN